MQGDKKSYKEVIIILGKFLTKDIAMLYGIDSIKDDGIISLKDKEIIIYKVNPANIVAWDMETKNRILSSYMATLRGLPEKFQIIVSKEKSSLKNDIEQYKKRVLEVENYGLKMALKKYVEYLQKIESENKIYDVKHYLVVERKDGGMDENIRNAFLNMNEFGIDIKRITRKAELESILKKAMQ